MDASSPHCHGTHSLPQRNERAYRACQVEQRAECRVAGCSDAPHRDACGLGTGRSAVVQSRGESSSGPLLSRDQFVRPLTRPQPRPNRGQRRRHDCFQGLGKSNARVALPAGCLLGPDKVCLLGQGVRSSIQAAGRRRCSCARRSARPKSSSLHRLVVRATTQSVSAIEQSNPGAAHAEGQWHLPQ